jgi:hypothetical protein
MPTILIAPHEREVPSNAPNEQLGHSAPDLYSAEREPEVRNRGECEDQGTVAERPQEAPPERTFNHHHLDEDGLDQGRVCTHNDRFESRTTTITTLDAALELSLEQLIGALDKKLFMECTKLQSTPQPMSGAMVTAFGAEVRSQEMKGIIER